MIAAELRRLTSSRMSLIALVALLLVPILYGGLYLWANQDPYGSLSRVPVALVVDDTGASVNGQDRNFGDEVADELLGGDTFEVASGHLRRRGHRARERRLRLRRRDPRRLLRRDRLDLDRLPPPGRHRAALRTTPTTTSPPRSATQAVARIQSTVAEKVVDQGGLTLLNALATIRIKLTDAATGAQQLVDGLGTARDGSSQLLDGAGQLAAGTAQLRDGAATLRDGAAQVSSGAQQVATGTQQVDAIADRVATASADAAALLPTARTDIAQALTDAGVDPARIADVLANARPRRAAAERREHPRAVGRGADRPALRGSAAGVSGRPAGGLGLRRPCHRGDRGS